jgi:aminocarboxymuconate-semialdehyde decarboxylase
MPGVDLHTHLAPQLPEPHTPREYLPAPAEIHDPPALVAHLDGNRLDEAVVSPPPPFFREGLEASFAADWAQLLNDGMLDAVRGEPRLLPLAYLPLEHPEVALEEYGRVRAQPGWAGICAAAGGASMSLASRTLAPLWRALHEDGRLLLLHPGRSPDARLDQHYLHNLLGNPVEIALAAAQLVLGDVLASYPGMRVLLVHGGGCVPSLVGRWDRGLETRRPGLGPVSEPAAQMVCRMYADCLLHDARALDLAVAAFGQDRIVLGSDWPFPMGTDDPRGLIAHRGAAFVDAVARANADACLGRQACREAQRT